MHNAVFLKYLAPEKISLRVSDSVHDLCNPSDCFVDTPTNLVSFVNSGRLVSDEFSSCSHVEHSHNLNTLPSGACILTVCSDFVSPELSTAMINADTLSSNDLANNCDDVVRVENVSLCDFTILHINIRGWRSHANELAAYCSGLCPKPTFVAVNETFLNRNCSAILPGYTLVGRRDRNSANINGFIDNLQSWVLFSCLLQKISMVLRSKCWNLQLPNAYVPFYIAMLGPCWFVVGIVHQLLLTFRRFRPLRKNLLLCAKMLLAL